MEHAVPQTQSPFATEPIGRLIVKFAVPCEESYQRHTRNLLVP